MTEVSYNKTIQYKQNVTKSERKGQENRSTAKAPEAAAVRAA